MYSHIPLPTKHLDLIRYSGHDFVYLFFDKFGFYPDRDGCYIQVTDTEAHIMFDEPRDMDIQLVEQIQDFFEDKKNFAADRTNTVMILEVDPIGYAKMTKELVDEKSVGIGAGHEQRVHFSKTLTEDEINKVATEFVKRFITFI